VVNLQPLLDGVANLPRHHLGSTLYAPRIEVPSSKASPESQKFGYTTTPVPLPRFEGKETALSQCVSPAFGSIRLDVKRFVPGERSGYRSLHGRLGPRGGGDPLRFHSREWAEDVDVDMLDLEIKDTYQHAPRAAEGESKSAPRKPPVPPPDKDLHITLLILPRLQRYESAVLFGLRSRVWDDTHDGMSFKVERIDWVDEGVTRGEERSGEARRKRLRNMMRSGRICTGPGLLRLRGSNVELPGQTMGMGMNMGINKAEGTGGPTAVEMVS